ncbi:MAG: UbiA family prenyltransferase [Acidobacteriota bacterium]|jgi:4-hydroxybenzoate polyprenyltransferase
MIKPWIRMTRPFTLLPPLLGILSGSACAWGSAHNLHPHFNWPLFWSLVVGSFCASLMNAASNIINQIHDLEIDRKNKPGRPLCTGEIGVAQAWVVSTVMYILALAPIWWIVPPPFDSSFAARTWAPWYAHACFWIYAAGLLCTFIYSSPALGRTKRYGIWANVTIAAARGELLKVAGWSMVALVSVAEPWYLGAVFFFFLLGASSTKDFSDMEGDRRGGCATLPVKYGPRRAAWMIAPAFVLPWLLLPAGVFLPAPSGGRLLTGNPLLIVLLGGLLILWGGYTVWLILRDPDSLAYTENHPSWTHMYAMMMFAQIGLGLAYLL